jgi:hypothetical protein
MMGIKARKLPKAHEMIVCFLEASANMINGFNFESRRGRRFGEQQRAYQPPVNFKRQRSLEKKAIGRLPARMIISVIRKPKSGMRTIEPPLTLPSTLCRTNCHSSRGFQRIATAKSYD